MHAATDRDLELIEADVWWELRARRDKLPLHEEARRLAFGRDAEHHVQATAPVQGKELFEIDGEVQACPVTEIKA